MRDLASLKQEVRDANLKLVAHGLVILTWGNVSGVDRERGVMAIKPSGVRYEDLTTDEIVLVNLSDGAVIDNTGLAPSSDTPTHLELYRRFPEIGGVCHTHSANATAFAQAGRPILCAGTTHADYFYGPVPITRPLRPEEIRDDYESHTGVVIAELWEKCPERATSVPAALVAGHGPFTWGKTAAAAVENAVVLEEIARIALASIALAPSLNPIDSELLDKHYLRKHGPNAYYGQKTVSP